MAPTPLAETTGRGRRPRTHLLPPGVVRRGRRGVQRKQVLPCTLITEFCYKTTQVPVVQLNYKWGTTLPPSRLQRIKQKLIPFSEARINTCKYVLCDQSWTQDHAVMELQPQTKWSSSRHAGAFCGNSSMTLKVSACTPHQLGAQPAACECTRGIF